MRLASSSLKVLGSIGENGKCLNKYSILYIYIIYIHSFYQKDKYFMGTLRPVLVCLSI